MIGRFEEAVLVTLLQAGGEATMPDIRNGLTMRGKPTTFGALYTTLTRMNKKNLIARRRGDPRPMPGGRSRYFYRITSNG